MASDLLSPIATCVRWELHGSYSERGNDMAEESKIESVVREQKTRRSAIKTAAQVAVTAPAVGLLLSASTKSALAQTQYIDTGDDGSFSDNPLNGNADQFTNGGNADDLRFGDDTHSGGTV